MNQGSTPQLADRLNVLAESATIAMAVKARELQAQGHDVIKLTLGEPDFKTPQFIQDAAVEAIQSGNHFKYTPVPGYPALREGIASKLKRDNGLDYKAENIVVSTGAKQSLINVLLSVVNKDDEVIVFTPYWVTYVEQVKLAEGVPVLVEGSLEKDFKVTPEQLRAAITPKTKAIMYSSPCNPTGSVYTKEELEALAEVLKDYPEIFVISDEIYEYINFGGEHASMAAIEGMKERTIIVNGFSKGHAMTGWRLGYIAAPLEVAKACNKIQGQVTSGTCAITQAAAITAVTGPLDETNKMKDAYLRRRDLVKSLLDEIDGIKTNLPQGAFYIFPDVSAFFGKSFGDTKIENSVDLTMYLLNEAHVSVVDGGSFGAPKCLRISFAASDEELKEACSRIKSALEKLA
ncbi:pyridoxal phosphate-dependent aminotransferase [Sediminitomix flava]|uniref:Aminotransferase n=1 Tax=Sediminitomix flava TaxID=379075 RepID=A0A315ZFR3_SEDFL|nr:pyridoxal phosphate-dependent aminotransferase [Sediminitomix flava]PWJ43980.1 aspartate aminotransferase [Sediminitomix flava]